MEIKYYRLIEVKPKFIRLDCGLLLSLDRIELINEEARCLFVTDSVDPYEDLTDSDLKRIKEHIEIV